MLHARLARKVLHASLTGMYVYDFKHGNNISINDQYTRLTGYSLEQLNSMQGNEFFALFHPENRERVIHHWAALREADDGEVVEIDCRFRRADGKWIWCLSRDSVLEREPEGSVRCVVGSFVDITERKRTERALRESEARFRTMADGVGRWLESWTRPGGSARGVPSKCEVAESARAASSSCVCRWQRVAKPRRNTRRKATP